MKLHPMNTASVESILKRQAAKVQATSTPHPGCNRPKNLHCDDCILGAGVDPQYSYEKIIHQIIEGIFRPGNKAVLGDY